MLNFEQNYSSFKIRDTESTIVCFTAVFRPGMIL